MRIAAWGLFVGLVSIAALGLLGYPEAQAQRPAAAPERAGTELIALSSEADGRQQVTVIDPRARVMAVYHVDRASGALALRSVRNVHWDLQMEEFNTNSPTPREIRPLTEQR